MVGGRGLGAFRYAAGRRPFRKKRLLDVASTELPSSPLKKMGGRGLEPLTSSMSR